MENLIGKIIREARIANNITLRKFADQVGISATYISQIEQHKCASPSVYRIEKIAKILNLNAYELMALAKKIPPDFQEVFEKYPSYVADFLKNAKIFDATQMQKTLNFMEKLNER